MRTSPGAPWSTGGGRGGRGAGETEVLANTGVNIDAPRSEQREERDLVEGHSHHHSQDSTLAVVILRTTDNKVNIRHQDSRAAAILYEAYLRDEIDICCI